MPGQHSSNRANGGASPRALSLRQKLLLSAAALVVVPGLVLAFIAERNARASLERVIGRQLEREARHTAERFSALLLTERQTLDSFARQDLMREVRVADIDKRVSMALKTLRDGSPLQRDYFVLDRDGRVVASSSSEIIGTVPEWADRDFVDSSAAELFLGPISSLSIDGDVVMMTTPIPDPDAGSRRIGTLVGIFDWEQLSSVTARVRRDLVAQGIAADVLVRRADGEIIGGAWSSSGRSIPGSAWSSGADPSPASVEPGPTSYATGDWIIGRAKLEAGLPPWELLIVEPRAHALAPARSLSTKMLLTMGIALIGALTLAALAARRVVEPLTELTRAIRDLSHGDASRLQVPVRSRDEVGTLARAFNEMASDLDRAQRDLVEAEKFAFVGQLAAGVAHEIRTALGVLGSSAQMLERSLPAGSSTETGELAQMIGAEVVRLGDVVNDLLTLDRARPLELEAVPISEPLFRAVDFVGPQALEEGIQIACTALPHEQSILCEPEVMCQVAVNLLVNAIRALPAGGRIQVTVLRAEEGCGGFEVRDDGPGIPQALREQIFEPFVTAREGGIGLGLTFVKRAVHDHRGTISLESDGGNGTSFRIRIPLAEARKE